MEGELKGKLKQSLAPVFGSSEPLFVTEDSTLVSWLRTHDLRAHLFDEVAGFPKHRRKSIVLLPTTVDGMSFFRLERFFKGSQVLIVPLVAFDPSFEASIYTIKLLASSDFVRATKDNARWISILEDSEVRRLVCTGTYGELEIILKERLDLMLPRTQEGLLPGEWEAIGMFFEIAMIPDVEMAISNNPGLDAHSLDWGINSVLNEGARGIHFAVGDGVTGAHIDFICPGMDVVVPS